MRMKVPIGFYASYSLLMILNSSNTYIHNKPMRSTPKTRKLSFDIPHELERPTLSKKYSVKKAQPQIADFSQHNKPSRPHTSNQHRFPEEPQTLRNSNKNHAQRLNSSNRSLPVSDYDNNPDASKIFMLSDIVDSKLLICASPIKLTRHSPQQNGGSAKTKTLHINSPSIRRNLNYPRQKIHRIQSSPKNNMQPNNTFNHDVKTPSSTPKSRSYPKPELQPQKRPLSTSNSRQKQKIMQRVEQYADKLGKFDSPNMSKFMKRSLNYIKRNTLLANESMCKYDNPSWSPLLNDYSFDGHAIRVSGFDSSAQTLFGLARPTKVIESGESVSLQAKHEKNSKEQMQKLTQSRSLRNSPRNESRVQKQQRHISDADMLKFTRLRRYYHKKYQNKACPNISDGKITKVNKSALETPRVLQDLSPW